MPYSFSETTALHALHILTMFQTPLSIIYCQKYGQNLQDSKYFHTFPPPMTLVFQITAAVFH